MIFTESFSLIYQFYFVIFLKSNLSLTTSFKDQETVVSNHLAHFFNLINYHFYFVKFQFKIINC